MRLTTNRSARAILAVALAGVLVSACGDGENADEIRSELGNAISDLESEVESGIGSELEAELESELAQRTEAQETEAQETEAPQTEAPETEAPATEDPASEAEPSESPDLDETADETDWLPLVLGLLALLLVVALLVAMRRRREDRHATEAELRAALGELIGTGRWVLDQGSIEVQRITEPQQLQRSWGMVRERLVGMEERISTLVVDQRREDLVLALTGLSGASESLRSVLDGTVALRSSPTSDPELEADNRQAVQQRRREFGTALDEVSSFR